MNRLCCVKTWRSLSQKEQDKYQHWKLSQFQPKPAPSRQSHSDIKIDPPLLKHLPKPASSEQNRSWSAAGNQTANVLFQPNSYSGNQPKHDWSGVKYDPAWDDGSAFPSLDKD